MGQQHGRDALTPQFRFAVRPGVGDAFEMWRWAVSPMFDISAARRQDTRTFAMDTTGYHFAEMAVSRTRSSATAFHRSNTVLARSGSDGILVQVYLKGGYVLDAAGRQSRVEAGDIALIVLTRQSSILADDYLNISLVLPQRILAPMLEPIDDLHGLVLRKGTPLNAFLTSHLKTLHAQAGRIGPAAGTAIVESTCALVAACMGATARGRRRRSSGRHPHRDPPNDRGRTRRSGPLARRPGRAVQDLAGDTVPNVRAARRRADIHQRPAPTG